MFSLFLLSLFLLFLVFFEKVFMPFLFGKKKKAILVVPEQTALTTSEFFSDFVTRQQQYLTSQLVSQGYTVEICSDHVSEVLAFLPDEYPLVFLLGRGSTIENGQQTAVYDMAWFRVAWNDYESLVLAANKARMKQMLRSRGVPVIESYIGDAGTFSLSQLLGVIRNVGGFPVVVKPLVGVWSQNVFFLRHEDDVRHFLPDLQKLRGDVMVEKYLEGPVLHMIAAVTKKGVWVSQPWVQRLSDGEFLDSEARVSDQYDGRFVPFLTKETVLLQHMSQMAQLCLKALYITAAARVEMILTPAGPVVLEVNPVLEITETSSDVRILTGEGKSALDLLLP